MTFLLTSKSHAHVGVKVALLLIVALCTTSVFAQSGAGSIQGTVADATGAVIPGATVHALNTATGVTADTKSNSVGFYQVPQLFAGSYTITVTAAGMKGFRQTLQLLVDQTAVINPLLVPGSVNEVVTVTSDSVQLVTRDDGTVASTLDNTRINQLPMNGRSLLTLAGQTTPGLEGGQRANGLEPEAMEYVSDGVTLTNRIYGGESGGQTLLPDPDSVQEVRLETSNPSARVATPGTVIITTKSGTNQVHGSLFETTRNNAFGIAKSRQNPANFQAPQYIRNEFGASVGGPIIIPHIYNGKDKSFWFVGYERYSLAQKTTYLMKVPTAAMRQGDFSGQSDGAGIPQQLYDPNTTTNSTSCNGSGSANSYCRTPFLNNKIPLSRLSPTAKQLYDIEPLPNNTNNPYLAPNLAYNGPGFQVTPELTVRLDHTFNENNKAYIRYNQGHSFQSALRNYLVNEPATLAADGFPANISGLQLSPVLSFAGAIGYTHIFSSNFFSETIVSNEWVTQNYTGGGDYNHNYASMLGLPDNYGQLGFPQITAGVYNQGGSEFGFNGNQIVTTLDENITKTFGRHQFEFGGRYRHERFGQSAQTIEALNFGAYATALENPTSGSNYTATANTGNADADMFLGAASSYSLSSGVPYQHYHDMEFDAYFQDNFHVNPKLTINIGLRYEAHPAPWVKGGGLTSIDLASHAIVTSVPLSTMIADGLTSQAIINNLLADGATFETAQQAGLPSKLTRDNNFTFGPRVGIAYQPSGDKGPVFRGGYGRYIYPVPANYGLTHSFTNAPLDIQSSQSYINANQSPDGLPNYLLRAHQAVVAGINSSNVINTNSSNAILPGIAPFYMDPDFHPSFVQSANVTVEQPIMDHTALRISYVYSHGSNLEQYNDINTHPSNLVWEMQTGTVPPTGGATTIGTNQYALTGTGPFDKVLYGSGVILNQSSGWSNDNALQANLQRLFHKGFGYQFYYVWSKPMRVGGNYFRDTNLYPVADYLGSTGNIGTLSSPFGSLTPALTPPAQPANQPSWKASHEQNRWQNYHLDSGIPLHHVGFNAIVDLPVGRGKRYLAGVNRFTDQLIGGWQVAGSGQVISQTFQVNASNWGATNPISVYKHKVPVTDCRSGNCYKAYQWFNGYISSFSNANSPCSAGNTKTVSGLPASYVPYLSPIDTTCGTANYGSNNVQVTSPNLNGGKPLTVPYSPGPQGANPYSQTFLPGPWNYNADLSLFKVFSITDRTSLRFNLDAFNAFNIQGYTNPNTSDGIEQVQPGGVTSTTSYWQPRQLQLTMRLTF